MDILKYAVNRNITQLNTCISTDIPALAYTCTYNAGVTAGADGTKWDTLFDRYSCLQRNNDLYLKPWTDASWTAIPTMPGGTTSTAGTNPATSAEYLGFKVCAANFNGGAACTWTVPAEATVARFQMWGAGAGSSSGCCCGGSTHGTTGAYASIIIPVTAGCQYTLCAGAACNTPVLWSVRNTNACPSFVTGYGLSNLCAQGGKGVNHWCISAYDLGGQWHFSGCCSWSANDCFAAGACLCNSAGDFCMNGCASCGIIPFSASKTTLFYGRYTGAINTKAIDCMYGSQVAGIPGLNGCHCFDTNFYGNYKHPPVYGFEIVSQCTVAHTVGTSVGGLMNNHISNNYMRVPGAGGTAVALFNGCTATCDTLGSLGCGGDIGRSGMVCVTYA